MVGRMKRTDVKILAGFIVVSLFWLVDAGIDFAMVGGVKEGRVTTHEGVMDILFFISQAILITWAWAVFRRRRRLEEALMSAMSDASAEKARADAILEVMPDAVSVQGSDFKVLYQNQAHKDLVGDHVGEFCFQAYCQKGGVCEGCPLFLSFQDGEVHVKEKSNLINGALKHVQITSAPLRGADGRITAGIEVVRDITAARKTEERINKLNEDLLRRALELTSANKELEAFSYSLSHDLRSPLTRIYASGQALDDGYAAEMDEKGRFLIRNICEGSEQMERLVEAMLVLSRVTMSELVEEETDLSALALNITIDLRLEDPHRQVELLIAPGMKAFCDPNLMKVALENLLANAWKFTQKSRNPRIEFGMTQSRGDNAFFIRDNGAGFDMANADKLFQPFKRLHNPKDFPGTGIGLATVQRVIQRHGGQVWGEGKPEAGATFYFTLPDGPPRDIGDAG